MAVKKVAIATWWNYHNYGSALQATAIYNVLKNLGFDADLINYIPSGKTYTVDAKTDDERNSHWLKYPRVVDGEREERFEEYLGTRLTFTQKTQSDDQFDELNFQYDAFIAGSDQIWAPSVFDGRYFLDFVRDNRKKIAYAPSVGLPAIKNEFVRAKMGDLISQFSHISVREQQGAKTLKDDLGIDKVSVVPDPTLLLGYEEWRNIIPEQKISKDKYILCYFLGENKNAWNHVKSIEKQTGLKVKIVPVLKKDEEYGDFIKGVGPEEFFNLVDSAELVLTDSFHGAIFSIITSTPFYVFERFKTESEGSQNSRVYNLLTLTTLEDRLIQYNDDTKDTYVLKVDFTESLKAIGREKMKALEYIDRAISEVPSESGEKTGLVDITKKYSVRSGVLSVVDPNIKTKLDKLGQYAYFIDENYKIPEKIQNNLDFVDSMYNLVESEDKVSDELYQGIGKHQEIIGHYNGLYVGHVTGKKDRQNSSSGGIVTYVLTKLLEEKEVDFVICPSESSGGDGVLYKYNICKTVNDVRRSAKTKYYPMELSEVLEYVKKHKGGYAVVGITGYIYEIRLLQKIDPVFKERIKYTIGLITCHQKTTKYTEQIAWQHGILPENLQKFQYRVKNNQLNPDVYLTEFSGKKDGKDVTIQAPATENYGTDWAHGFFKVYYSDFTDDVFNKTADVVFGDAWDERWIQDKGGNNVVICRNGTIKNILQNGMDAGDIEAVEVSEDDVLTTQKGNIHHMVDDLPYRIAEYGDKRLRICNESKYLKQIPIERQLVQKVRHDITFKSHIEYMNAISNGSYKQFIDRTRYLVDEYEQLYILISRIRSLDAETSKLRLEGERLNSVLDSFMSTKRSARLFIGNIKRHYARGPLGRIKRVLRIRTRIKDLLRAIKYLPNKIYWLPKTLFVGMRVRKIAKGRLARGDRIPKVLHYIWVGGNKKPESVEKYIATWREHCPDYEIIEWNEKNYNVMANRYAREAYKAKKWAFVTDYMRLDILDRFGGIYVDSDVEILKSFDKFLQDPAFSSFETGDPTQTYLPTGMMAGEKGGDWVKYLKTYYSHGRSFYTQDGQMDNTTNTTVITRMTVSKYGIKLNNKLQKFDDFTMYPSEYFCPKSWSTREINLTKNSHAIHHFAGSWVAPEDRVEG